MLQTSDGETEILLGNKQLLGIFFVVVILLGVAFAGGYKVGQGSKKAGYSTSNVDQTAAAGPSAAETHSVAPDRTAAGNTTADSPTPDRTSSPVSSTPAQSQPVQTQPAQSTATASSADTTRALGSSKSSKAAKPEPEDTEAPGPPSAIGGHDAFTPQPGQMFLQVAAVGRDEAEGISDVLRKKSFRAHAVPKPGSTKLYRVIIGPMRDASDLSNTRAALRNTGFREIIVQKY